MTIGAIALIVIGAILFIGGLIYGIICIKDGERGTAIGVILVCTILGVAGVIGPIIWQNTETGKRALKDQQSNFTGGITRVVRIYDVQGDEIAQYKGRFDVETDNDGYILFDDENGNRHIIYNATGIITIDELDAGGE